MSFRRPLAIILVLCAVVAVVAAVALGGWAAGAGPFAGDESVPLKVMTLNIFYGGDDYDLVKKDWCATSNGCPATLDKVAEAIRSAGADVVGLEEGEGNTEALAERLGWHASARTQIVSQYPLFDPPEAKGAYVLVEVMPGKVVAVSSVHLPATPYGPYVIRDGGSEAKVMALERSTRVPALEERLKALAGVRAAGIPVFLVGDFNSPSHLDWTEAVADARDAVRYPVAWPASVLAEEAGFRDSYRETYPDPLARPGFTWTPGGPEAAKKEVHDRIDWVLAAGDATTVNSGVVGERSYAGTDVAVDPFPSDHRGVVSTFDVDPANMPDLISLDTRRVYVGDDLTLGVHVTGESGGRVVIVPRGGDPAKGASGTEVPGGTTHGLAIGTAGDAPGAYDAVLVTSDGEIASRAPFSLYAQGAPAEITTARSSLATGVPIVVRFRNAPGNRWDWVGLYKAVGTDVPVDGSIPADSGDYLLYDYTHTEVDGEVTISGRSHKGSGSWPLPPGTYEVRLMLDDGYRTIARSGPFTVTG